ncbi:asparaginase [Aminithiophilus ramosus]|uniref:Asparaginase n=1 Tax=Aminithiophilus ramosus TaxID=3029084 RepID=A0A9Q7AKS7_9BACT|nr:asparaginase domain-containing protein [Aminithiophilus ramosus]QTX31318.1 asparaginase [Aminithiophilus ramosus]
MKSVTAVLTGGTIGSAVGAGGAFPDGGRSSELRSQLERFFSDGDISVSFRYPWGEKGLDSSNLQPWHWIDLTRLVVAELEGGAQGILLLHGTDTMAYTSAWLSLALGDVDRPVILTGSQLTLDSVPDDVTVNLRGAALVAASSLPGVWVYFNWKLFRGDRAHKARALHPDAFVASGGSPLYFTPDRIGSFAPVTAPSPWRRPRELDGLLLREEEVRALRGSLAWISAAPGLRPHFSGREKVLLVLGLGAGNASTLLIEEIDSFWQGREKPFVLACSLAEGDEKKPDVYDDVGLASLARRGFPLWSQGDYPLEMIHALAWFSLMGAPEDRASVFSRYLRRL